MALSVGEARPALRGRGVPDGCTGSALPVDASYVDANGALSTVGADVLVGDAGIELEVAALDGELLATIAGRCGVLTFHWDPATGAVALWRYGAVVEERTLPPLPAGRTTQRVEFGALDDRVFFCLDGDAQRLFVVPHRPEWLVRGGSERTWVYFGCVGRGAGLAWRRVRVFHDIQYYRDKIAGLAGGAGGWPRHPLPGEWFLLGDCAFDSRDSRHFGAVRADSFIGVPRAVLGPAERRRWLDR
jgi:hypothetical protein